MARIPKRLVGPGVLTTTSTTKYTVPSTTKTIIRQIHAYNPGTTSDNLTMSIGSDAAGTRIFDAYPVPAGTAFDPPCYYVLETGEVLQAKDSTGLIVLTVNGDEIVLG